METRQAVMIGHIHAKARRAPLVSLSAATQQELRIVSDQIGCPTAASDIADTLLLLAEKSIQKQPQWGIFHYTGDKPVSWFAFANTILNEAKDHFPLLYQTIHPITTAEYPTPAKRPKNSIMSVDKIRKTYGVSPASWEKSLLTLLKRSL